MIDEGTTLLTLAVVVVGYLATIVICFRKGKPVFGLIGLVGLLPPAAPIAVWFPIVGAARLAKPDSQWARQRYDLNQLHAAAVRFARPVAPTMSGSGVRPALEEPPAIPPGESRREVDSITAFLADARTAGILPETTFLELVEFAEQRGSRVWVAPAPTSVSTAVPSAPIDPPEAATPAPAPILPPEAATLPSEPQPEPPLPTRPSVHPAAHTVTKPIVPDWWSARLHQVWDAVRSDIALHGFAYLGVILTIAGVLGFLLFAFVDVPDETQPFVELFIASVFFGWGWALRRQGAHRVGQSLTLIGGMVLPLVLFAGLVDDAPFPPDFEGPALVPALATSAVALAGAYAWISTRRPGSALRYLVGPLVWLAAMSLGFAFKTDEPLLSDAITRLVPAQPALGAAAIALTVGACRRWQNHRLTTPTQRSALVGLPVSYLLTVSLAAGSGWNQVWPLVIMGASIFVSVELLAPALGLVRMLPPARLLLLAAILIPLVPTIGTARAGVVSVMAFLVLDGLAVRSGEPSDVGTLLTAAGMLTGALMTLTEPWAMLAATAVITVWSPLRRARHQLTDQVDELILALGALAPIGIAAALLQLLGSRAWLVIAALIAVAGEWGTRRGRDTGLWTAWIATAATATAWGALLAWTEGDVGMLGSASVAVAAIPILRGHRFPVLRRWAGATLLFVAGTMVLEDAAIAWGARSVVWAVIGLTVVVAGVFAGRRPIGGDLAAIGHLIGLFSLLVSERGATLSAVWWMWTAAWVVSTIAAERTDHSLVSMLERLLTGLTRGATGVSAAARWLPPTIAAASLPIAADSALHLWQSYADHRSWTGIAMTVIALGYAAASRASASRGPLWFVLGGAAMLLSLTGVAVTAPDPWPSITAAAGVLAVAGTLRGDLRARGFVWFAWAMTFVLTMLLANRAGVDSDRLHLVSLGWSVLMLIGGLLYDDATTGRRQPGEGIETRWVRRPVVLGAVGLPVSLGPVYLQAPEEYGWWSLAGAVTYLALGFLLRAGSVSGIGYALAAIGAVALSPWPMLDAPWRMVAIAVPLVAISWASALLARTETPNPWLRWDVAPLVVAHAVGAFALIVAMTGGGLSATGVAFGTLSFVVAGWRRRWAWVDLGNLLVLVAAVDAGSGWLTLALAATAIRGMVVGAAATGMRRAGNQLTGVSAFGGAWLAYLDWVSPSDAAAVIGQSAVVWGVVALLVAVASKSPRVENDTVMMWAALDLAALVLIGAGALAVGASAVEGPWLAIGYLMLAIAVELAASRFPGPVRMLQLPAVAAAWVAVAVGAGWSVGVTVDATAVVFGALVVGSAELSRQMAGGGHRRAADLGLARAWLALGGLGTVAAALGVAHPDVTAQWPAVGLGLLAIGAARGAQPMPAGRLREISALAAVFALLFASSALGWSIGASAGMMLVAATIATAVGFWWASNAEVAWLPAVGVFAATADLAGLWFGLRTLPETTLTSLWLLAVGTQALAHGWVTGRDWLMATGPLSIGAGSVLAIEQTVTGSPQWFTVPIGVALLAEVEILRRHRRGLGIGRDDYDVIAMEAAGLALLVATPMFEMFTTGLGFALVTFAVAGACLLWAIVTRVRRRVIAAGAIALGTGVMMLAAAAARGAPSSAFFWILAVGIGFSVTIVAGLIEAFRSRRGRVVARLDGLMEGWS